MLNGGFTQEQSPKPTKAKTWDEDSYITHIVSLPDGGGSDSVCDFFSICYVKI
jgi:hypothetical protein